MHGDFSRRTFDAVDGYRAVLLQQGRVLLDADWNEQADITSRHDEVRTLDIVGRSGGAAPAPGATGIDAAGPFGIVTAQGDRPEQARWRELRITPGRYYVGGVLCESPEPPASGGKAAPVGWPLTDQPHLPAPGSAEPDALGRHVLYLDVWQRHVTADEDAALLEAALGGPDTTTRSRTVWQVRVAPVPDGLSCSDLGDGAPLGREPRRMAAQLAPPDVSADPCQITGSGGYQRLENQLYRVQVHDGGGPNGAATFLWSRENGSVVAGLDDIAVVDETAGIAVLTVDRVGRDEELSIREGHLLEVTSAHRELHGRTGLLATAGAPTGQQIPVTWFDPAGAPRLVEDLGAVPIVRRWEGGPLPMAPSPTALEGGIAVRFPAGGRAETGDYWTIPARTVRLTYGLDQISGTIEWPPGGRGDVEQPPEGPLHQRAPLAILEHENGRWTLESDCRRLFPPITGLVAIDLAGGDGQEAMPGDPLPAPVRVVVRSGDRPIAGARLSAAASHGGHLSVSGAPSAADPSTVLATTGTDGVAEVSWLLDVKGPTTQTLTIRRLDDHDGPVDVPVVATARLSVAGQVRWDPVCDRFAKTRTVQDALELLVRTAQLRFLGGDGQQVSSAGEVVPRPIRVGVFDGCGPVAGVPVRASADSPITGGGRVAAAKGGQGTPDTLGNASATAVVPTDSDGVAAFWWQPSFGNMRWSVLDIDRSGSDDAPIRVTAQLDPAGGGQPRAAGIHIAATTFASGVPFLNDTLIARQSLGSGIDVALDGPVLRESVLEKPVCRVLLDLPWPLAKEDLLWSDRPIGIRTIELAGFADADGERITWRPAEDARQWVIDTVPRVLADNKWASDLLGRFVLDGWAVVGARDPALHVNCHAPTAVGGGAGTRILLPTDDEVAGGQFVQWFRLDVVADGGRPRIAVPDVVGRTEAVAVRELAAAGLVAEVRTDPSADVRKGLVIRIEPVAGIDLPGRSPVTVVVSTGRPA